MEKKYLSPKSPAIIDIGSNSVRMMFAGDSFSKQSIVTRLSEGLYLSGYLSDESIKRTLEAITNYVNLARQAGTQDIHIFGTQAMRQAKNAQTFQKIIYDKTGCVVEILDSQTEALCGFLGATSDIHKDSKVCVIDIGGASTEITVGIPPQEKIIYSKSIEIGVVTLKDLFFSDTQKFDSLIKDAIREYGLIDADYFVGIGGTFSSLSAMIMGLKTYDASKVDNSKINIIDLQKLKDHLWHQDSTQIYNEYQFLGQRAQVIKYGALWSLELMKHFKISTIQASEKDSLEGYCVINNIKP